MFGHVHKVHKTSASTCLLADVGRPMRGSSAKLIREERCRIPFSIISSNNTPSLKGRYVNKDKFQTPKARPMTRTWHFWGQGQDIRFMIKAKAEDLCFPGVKTKAIGHCFLRNFSRTSADSMFRHCYIVLCRPKIYN